jgi:YVTN family beta-propeller protein
MNTRKYLIKNSLVACLVGCCVSLASAGNPPFFTTDAVLNAKGELLMTQKGTRHLDIFSADGKSLLHSFPFDEIPTGLLPDGDKVYVTTFEKTGRLQVLSLESGRVEAAIPTGSGACHPMFGPDKKHIYVCNQFDNSVVEIDPVMRKVVRSVKVLREPKSAVFSKDGKYMFVTNFLPAQRADVDVVAACVSVIEMEGFTKVKDIQLANGSNALRGMCITPDGKYIYVSHNLGRFTVPTSQLQQGWMNTSAFSVIDVAKREFVGAVLVDEPDRGAAGIWSIACDDKHIFITHSGTHEVSVIDHPAMLAKFESYKEIKEERKQKKLLQEALQSANAANRAKTDFLSRMSHDIRTPINAIVGMTAIAGLHMDDQMRIADCLKKITISSKLLLNLINEVLDMSKLESDKIMLTEEAFKINELLESLFVMVQPAFEAKKQKFQIHVTKIKHECLIGDVQRIQQALLNMLTNAIAS